MPPDDPNDQARLFYLALLGLAIGAGLVHHYRRRLGVALQHLAIWGLIILGLVVAYGFKDEFVSQLFPDRAQPAGAGMVTLRRAGDGHFYARLAVDGTEVRFLVDTGATSVVLSQADAARIGLNPDSLDYVVPASTANGMVMGAPVILDRVALGDIADWQVRALVNGGQMQSSLLGMSYLDRFRRLSVEGDRLVLQR